ncbi:hypothetical protein FPV67DRAFT_336296 [Lyophyllum atratum]|nr:hypothetical protein FPV67DRAFT_336296 [Lyophyllum atratum]
MHDCLEVFDILTIIFQDLDLSSLASLARTCHAFTEPALDILWYEQPTLGFLIQVMPSDLWHLKSIVLPECSSGHEDVVAFKRPLKESDWSRVEYYGKKIRRLGWSSLRKRRAVHESVAEAILEYQPRRSLLPNLREALFTFDSSEPIEESDTDSDACLDLDACPDLDACLVLGPSVETIRVILNRNSFDSVTKLFSNIVQLCPQLSSFSLVSSIPSLEGATGNIAAMYTTLSNLTLESIFAILCDLKSLRSLDIDFDLVSGLASDLATLPSLERLHCAHISPELLAQADGFRSLRHFVFHSESWEIAAAVVTSLQLPFETLDVTMKPTRPDTQENPGHMGMLMASLDHHPCLHSLLNLRLIFQPPNSDYHHEDISEPGVLRSLCALTSLRCINLNLNLDRLGLEGELTDSWLMDASLGWPALRSLTISNNRRNISQITLPGLIPLIKHCPHLHTLSIPILGDPVDPPLFAGVRNDLIETLDFWYSPIKYEPVGSPALIANMLMTVFPRLRRVAAIDPYRLRNSAWDDVKDLVRLARCGVPVA